MAVLAPMETAPGPCLFIDADDDADAEDVPLDTVRATEGLLDDDDELSFDERFDDDFLPSDDDDDRSEDDFFLPFLSLLFDFLSLRSLLLLLLFLLELLLLLLSLSLSLSLSPPDDFNRPNGIFY